jgi:hypothetical protein
MRDPGAIIAQARQGNVPAGWEMFTRRRGAVEAFFNGTSGDPDPLLVFTTDAVVEYINAKKPPAAAYFADLESVRLAGRATTSSDSSLATLHVWLDLRSGNGAKDKWQSHAFQGNLEVIQQFLESYGAWKARSR